MIYIPFQTECNIYDYIVLSMGNEDAFVDVAHVLV